MKKLFAFLSLFLTIFAFGETAHKQLIVVVSEDINASDATLQRYELKENLWERVGEPFSIKIGRNGMGWGVGLHQTPKDATIIKKEGDGRSPMGIFSLGSAFGYEPFAIKYPYSVMSKSNRCVDDANSKYYNQIIDANTTHKDYTSYEEMKFEANYYKYGVVVKHNPKNEKNRGSCIFLHIKSIPTAGCGAMSEDEIKKLLVWLRLKDRPLLVQGIQSNINMLLKEAINLKN